MSAAVVRLIKRWQMPERVARVKAFREEVERARMDSLQKELAQHTAIVKLQTWFRGSRMRRLFKAELKRRSEAVTKIQAFVREVLARQAAVRARDAGPRSNRRRFRTWDPGTLRASFKERRTPVVRTRSKRPTMTTGGRKWRAGSELPQLTEDELWELLLGGDRTMPVRQFVELVDRCRLTGLTSEVYYVYSKQLEEDDPEAGKRPENIYPRQVAALLRHLIDDPELEVHITVIREIFQSVPASTDDAAVDYTDFNFDREATFGLKVFKSAIAGIAQWLGLEESWVIMHMEWCETGWFDIPPLLGNMFLDMVLQRVSQMADRPRINVKDMHRLCRVLQVLDPLCQTGLAEISVTSLFQKTMREMPGSFIQRFRRRPKNPTQRDWEIGTSTQRAVASGWTEVSMLLQKLYEALKSLPCKFDSPLRMCLAGITLAPDSPRMVSAASVRSMSSAKFLSLPSSPSRSGTKDEACPRRASRSKTQEFRVENLRSDSMASPKASRRRSSKRFATVTFSGNGAFGRQTSRRREKYGTGSSVVSDLEDRSNDFKSQEVSNDDL